MVPKFSGEMPHYFFAPPNVQKMTLLCADCRERPTPTQWSATNISRRDRPSIRADAYTDIRGGIQRRDRLLESRYDDSLDFVLPEYQLTPPIQSTYHHLLYVKWRERPRASSIRRARLWSTNERQGRRTKSWRKTSWLFAKCLHSCEIRLLCKLPFDFRQDLYEVYQRLQIQGPWSKFLSVIHPEIVKTIALWESSNSSVRASALYLVKSRE